MEQTNDTSNQTKVKVKKIRVKIPKKAPTEGSWESLKVDKRLCNALKLLEFKAPAPVQLKAIDLSSTKDVFVCAGTGSGKTLAYLVPILNDMIINKINKDTDENSFYLILQPTRELVSQVTLLLKNFLRVISGIDLAFKNTHIIGLTGVYNEQDAHMLSTTNYKFIVGTPGLITEFAIEKSLINLSNTKIAVLDEADGLMRSDFLNDLTKITSKLSQQCQRMLFSATLNTSDKNLADLTKVMVNDNARIITDIGEKGEKANVLDITKRLGVQHLMTVKSEFQKYLLIYSLISLQLVKGRIIIFCNGQNSGYKLKLFFEKFGIGGIIIYDPMLPTNVCLKSIKKFNSGESDLLIAIDPSSVEKSNNNKTIKENDNNNNENIKEEEVKKECIDESAAYRGLDFVAVDVVINYDMPENAIIYTHRIGRAARGVFINEACAENIATAQAITIRVSDEKHGIDELRVVKDIENKQKELYGNVFLKDFDIDLEPFETNFTYRVNDVLQQIHSPKTIKTYRGVLIAKMIEESSLLRTNTNELEKLNKADGVKGMIYEKSKSSIDQSAKAAISKIIGLTTNKGLAVEIRDALKYGTKYHATFDKSLQSIPTYLIPKINKKETNENKNELSKLRDKIAIHVSSASALKHNKRQNEHNKIKEKLYKEYLKKVAKTDERIKNYLEDNKNNDKINNENISEQ